MMRIVRWVLIVAGLAAVAGAVYRFTRQRGDEELGMGPAGLDQAA
jgi:hypothetical protein